MRATTEGVLLLVLGLFAIAAFAADKCILEVETINVQLDLSPSNDYCDQSSVTINGIVKSKCKNNGDNCKNYHHRWKSTLNRRCCVPVNATTQIVTGTVQVSNSDNSCTKDVTYRFANATECKCSSVGKVKFPIVWISVITPYNQQVLCVSLIFFLYKANVPVMRHLASDIVHNYNYGVIFCGSLLLFCQLLLNVLCMVISNGRLYYTKLKFCFTSTPTHFFLPNSYKRKLVGGAYCYAKSIFKLYTYLCLRFVAL